jgi:hypothetical protein
MKTSLTATGVLVQATTPAQTTESKPRQAAQSPSVPSSEFSLAECCGANPYYRQAEAAPPDARADRSASAEGHSTSVERALDGHHNNTETGSKASSA